MTTRSVSLDTDVALAIQGEADSDDRSFSYVANRKLRAALGLPEKRREHSPLAKSNPVGVNLNKLAKSRRRKTAA